MSSRWHWLEPVTYPALLLLLLIAFYWKITLTYEYDWMSGPALTQQVLPWFEEEARQMQHRHFPAWDPHTWSGQPFLGPAQPGAAYPLNWLLFLFPRQRGHIDTLALQWYFIAMHYMAALFCYLLCRDLALTRFASLAGGLIFSLGACIGTLNWPPAINGAVWAPLVFLFLLRTVRGVRPPASAALCGLCWGLSWLSGDNQAPLFISLAAGLTWLWYVWRDRSWKLAGLVLLSLLFVFLTGALQILPAEAYGRLASRWSGAPQHMGWNGAVPYTVQQSFSASPLTVLGIVIPIPGIDNNAGPFIGIVASILSLTAVVTAWNRSEVKLFTALAAGGFAYALGFHNVFQGLIYAVVPFVDKAPTPALAIVIFGFGAAVLAACGIDELCALRGSGFVRRVVWGLAGFGLLIWFVAYCVLLAKAFAWPGDDRVIMTGLLAVLAAGLLLAWQKGNLGDRAAALLLTALMLIELGNVAGADFADRNDYARSSPMHAIRGNKDVADFLGRQPRPFRVDIDTDELPLNWPEYNNFDQMKSYVASLTNNWTPLEPQTLQARSLFGVQFTIGRGTAMPDATPVFEGVSGIEVFRNPHAFPRAWAVHETVAIAKPSDGQELIRDHLEELHSKAFMQGEHTGLETCATADAVMVTRQDTGHVTIAANMACDGMVVLSDTFYTGWTATVDKKAARIYEVNFAMRGVAVPRGVHEINYRYRPASVYAGAAMSATGVLGSCLIAFFDRRRRHPIDMEPKRENNQS